MMTTKFLAAGSVALMGAGSMLGTATAANAYTDADCGEAPAGSYLSLINGNICSLTFNADSSTNWDVPAGIDRLAAVLVGAGGGAVSFLDCGYGGGGGEVLYIDDVDLADIASLTVGAPGNADINWAGFPTTLGDYEARGGALGDDNATTGWSGNGNLSSYSGSDLHGGGSKSAATVDGPGEGYVLSDPDLTQNDELFPDTGSTSQWGRGGSGTESPEVNAYGTGGHMGGAGTQGAAVFRWSLDDMTSADEESEDLAATGVDANGIGMTAGALGLSGVALGVVAAIRRSRRAK